METFFFEKFFFFNFFPYFLLKVQKKKSDWLGPYNPSEDRQPTDRNWPFFVNSLSGQFFFFWNVFFRIFFFFFFLKNFVFEIFLLQICSLFFTKGKFFSKQISEKKICKKKNFFRELGCRIGKLQNKKCSSNFKKKKKSFGLLLRNIFFREIFFENLFPHFLLKENFFQTKNLKKKIWKTNQKKPTYKSVVHVLFGHLGIA